MSRDSTPAAEDPPGPADREPAPNAPIDATDEGELERTIGLAGALTIGIGTMIGAGIFVFPGLAAERAGPAAALSFVIGGVIALLVALPASELATAMPRSGGGYFFISRSLGTAAGAVVGLGLWLGLVFASAFYLVGLGHYANAALHEVGLALPVDPVVPLALVFAVLLTLASIGGTENSATLQNYIVGALLVILAIFLTYGGLDALGVFGREAVPEAFFPRGVFPVFSTAGLVFTSYLGFAQVATVAGDVTDPGRTLPLAMVGSVLIVTVLYVITIFVATSAFGAETLGRLGETAIVEVAREYLGRPGAVAILVAGILATISSANASILSASRTVYALSRDSLLPDRAGTINLRYGTPHIALLAAGGPIVVLVLTGQVELLAEVASFLHLIMYALIGVAVIVLRRRSPTWYDPSYEMPGMPYLPAIAAVASLGLALQMQLSAIAIGVLVMAVSYGWYRYYAPGVDLAGVFE